MIYRFVFRHAQTGETREAVALALNSAARAAGLPLDGVGAERKLAPPWTPWECWTWHECLWHYDANGECCEGPRP